MSTQLTGIDHYSVLGVDKDASAPDLKRAYRRLARTHHPDVNSSPHAADMFARIGEAFRVLSDPAARADYDRALARAAAPHPSTSPAAPATGRGGDLHAQAAVPFTDAATGATCELTLHYPAPCQGCAGTGYDPAGAKMTCPGCDSLGMSAATGTTCPTCHGSGSITDKLCTTCGGAGCTATSSSKTVTLPAGLREGQRLRLARQGTPAAGGGAPGDLYVSVTIVDHPLFKRVPGRPHDVGLALPVTYAELVLGAQLPIPVPGGAVATFHLPAGTAPNSVLPMPGHGLPAGDGQRGDLLVWVNLAMPGAPSPAHRAALEELRTAEISAWDPRDGLFSSARAR